MSEVPRSKIQKLHVGVQILAHAMTSIAAIIVAFWGYYSAIYVKKEKEVTEYTLKELKQKTTQKPHVQAKVDLTVQSGIDEKKLLIVKVTLSNLGNRESRVTLDNDALTLVPVAFSGGNASFQQPISLQSGRYAGTINRIPLNFVDIGAGESHEITFARQIENPGVYLIHFLALNDTVPPEQDVSITGLVPYKYAVGVDQYVVVE